MFLCFMPSIHTCDHVWHVWHVSFSCMTHSYVWPIHTCDSFILVTHSYVRMVAKISMLRQKSACSCVSCVHVFLSFMCWCLSCVDVATSRVTSHILCVTWHISCVTWHILCVTWLFHTCAGGQNQHALVFHADSLRVAPVSFFAYRRAIWAVCLFLYAGEWCFDVDIWVCARVGVCYSMCTYVFCIFLCEIYVSIYDYMYTCT